MAQSSIPGSFEYICHRYTTIIHILIFTVREPYLHNIESYDNANKNDRVNTVN